MSDLILHHYWPSPFAHKIRLALGLLGNAWKSVEIPRVPPKPLLMPLTAGYRRTPVLQSGADVYCDTQNIVRALTEITDNHQLLPTKLSGKILAFTDWADGAVFNLAARVVLTSALDTAPPEFIQDRGGLYFGPNWTPEGLRSQLPGVILQLAAHLNSIDSGLSSQGGFMSNDLSYADVTIAYLAWFIRGRWDQGPEFLQQFANIERIEREVHEAVREVYEDLSAEDALKIAANSESQSPSGMTKQCGVTLKQGMQVAIKPQAETSDPPVVGRLRYLDRARVSIDHHAPEVGDVVVHLPIAGYQIQPCE
ncbi:MAG: glutathione S-transferase family protein [Gammaproteobacteria bacterium]|nr:glutathione S-transferase family protein [Gammaproteobacteria bacterium]